MNGLLYAGVKKNIFGPVNVQSFGNRAVFVGQSRSHARLATDFLQNDEKFLHSPESKIANSYVACRRHLHL